MSCTAQGNTIYRIGLVNDCEPNMPTLKRIGLF